MIRPAILALAVSVPHLADADGGIVPVDYEVLQDRLTEIVDFERLPRRPEPGINLDMPLRADGLRIGERFAGQTITEGPGGHDRVSGQPTEGALRITQGAERQNLSIAFHRALDSNALFPLGFRQFPALESRGEGAAALLFDDDQAEVGLRLHAEYPAPLGQRPVGQGMVSFTFFARDGSKIGSIDIPTRTGIIDIGFQSTGGVSGIAGILILNSDPGGIAVDDIIFARPALLG